MKNITLKNALSSLVAIVLIMLMIVPAFATTLADSFSSGTYKTCAYYSLGVYKWTKYCWAKTEGYTGSHYVRAYIGGTNSDPSNAVADTGRCYSNGNIKRTCSYFLLYPYETAPWFPTGYAKYGT